MFIALGLFVTAASYLGFMCLGASKTTAIASMVFASEFFFFFFKHYFFGLLGGFLMISKEFEIYPFLASLISKES